MFWNHSVRNLVPPDCHPKVNEDQIFTEVKKRMNASFVGGSEGSFVAPPHPRPLLTHIAWHALSMPYISLTTTCHNDSCCQGIDLGQKAACVSYIA